MKKYFYAYISIPEFTKNKLKTEYIPNQDRQIMNNENKNVDEKESCFSFAKNIFYHEINACSHKESSESQHNSENIMDLLQKQPGKYTSRGQNFKDSYKEILNKTVEVIPRKNNPSHNYKSRNTEKITYNYTATQRNKYLINKSNSGPRRTKITANSNIIKNNLQKPQITSQSKRQSMKTKITYTATKSFMANEPKTEEKKIAYSKRNKPINIKEDNFNINNLPINDLIRKNTAKDLSLNHILNTNNLSDMRGNIIPNIAYNSSNNRKKKTDSDKNNQEKNVIKNNNIPNIEENKSLETIMKDIATELENLTGLVHDQSSDKSDYMVSQTNLNNNLIQYIESQKGLNNNLIQYIESQKGLNNNLDTYMENLNQYMADQSSYNKKLDKYLEKQSNLNEKLDKFLNNQYSKRK